MYNNFRRNGECQIDDSKFRMSASYILVVIEHRKKIFRAHKASSLIDEDVTKIVNEALSNIREVKQFHTEKHETRQYNQKLKNDTKRRWCPLFFTRRCVAVSFIFLIFLL
eukprot:UN26088